MLSVHVDGIGVDDLCGIGLSVGVDDLCDIGLSVGTDDLCGIVYIYNY